MANVSKDNIYLKNQYWIDYCENAPSDTLKEMLYLKLELSYLVLFKKTDSDELKKKIAALSRKLDKKDYQYMYDNAVNSQERAIYKKKIEELGQRG